MDEHTTKTGVTLKHGVGDRCRMSCKLTKSNSRRRNKLADAVRSSKHVRKGSITVSGDIVSFKLRKMTDEIIQDVLDRISNAIDRSEQAQPDYRKVQQAEMPLTAAV